MRNGRVVIIGAFTATVAAVLAVVAFSRGAGAQDAIQEAQTPRQVQATRPEQQKTEHDRSDAFTAAKAPRSSSALETQPQKGEVQGFDFVRDPLDAKRPGQSPDEIVQKDIADK